MDAAADIAWTSLASVDSIRGWRKSSTSESRSTRHGAAISAIALTPGFRVYAERCVIASRLKMQSRSLDAPAPVDLTNSSLEPALQRPAFRLGDPHPGRTS
jgi:hypothetical protein